MFQSRSQLDIGYQHDFLTTNYFRQECQKEHLDRVREIRPAVDSSAPALRELPHLKTRAKKQMMAFDRQLIVERDNAALLKRLSHVMSTKQVDDQLQSAAASDVHRKTRQIKRLLKWQQIAAENAAMSKRLDASKSLYSRERFAREREEEQKTPAANSRLLIPWTTGESVSRVPRRANFKHKLKEAKKKAQEARMAETMPPPPRSMSVSNLQDPSVTKTRLQSFSSMSSSMFEASRVPRPGESAGMQMWEEIKQWPIWTTQDVGTSTQSILQAPSADLGGSSSMRTRSLHGSIRAAAPLEQTSVTSFVGHDLVLHKFQTVLDDGHTWVLKVIEVGATSVYQDDVMSHFRIEASRMSGGPVLSVIVSVPDARELATKHNDVLLAAALKRCGRLRVKDGPQVDAYHRLTSLRMTQVNGKPTSDDWTEEANRSRQLQKKLSKFLCSLLRVIMDDAGNAVQLIVDMSATQPVESQPVTWNALQTQSATPEGSSADAADVVNE